MQPILATIQLYAGSLNHLIFDLGPSVNYLSIPADYVNVVFDFVVSYPVGEDTSSFLAGDETIIVEYNSLVDTTVITRDGNLISVLIPAADTTDVRNERAYFSFFVTVNGIKYTAATGMVLFKFIPLGTA